MAVTYPRKQVEKCYINNYIWNAQNKIDPIQATITMGNQTEIGYVADNCPWYPSPWSGRNVNHLKTTTYFDSIINPTYFDVSFDKRG